MRRIDVVEQCLRALAWASLLTVCAFAASAQQEIPKNSAASAVAQTPGWHKIPNTQLASVCPDTPEVHGNSGCAAIISAWNGGIADTAGNRLIFFGGGHFDYYGNEVYALDLTKGSLRRLTEPSPVGNLATCPESYSDGTPGARHTYNGLAYLASQSSLYLYGGARSPCGHMSNATWLLDLVTQKWTQKDAGSTEGPAEAPGAAADYDPVTQKVYLTDTRAFFSYDPAQNKYAKLNGYSGLDYHLNAVVDPDRRLFILIGGPGQIWAIDLKKGSKYELRDLAKRQRGCDELAHSGYPGLAYDSNTKTIVGWVGGDSVYSFDPSTATCTTMTYTGGPGPAQQNGTNGRFRYFPALDLFALVNDWKQDAYLLKLGK